MAKQTRGKKRSSATGGNKQSGAAASGDDATGGGGKAATGAAESGDAGGGPPRFFRLSPDQLSDLLQRVEPERRIDSIHLHYTICPKRQDYDPDDGRATLSAMWRFHTQRKKFVDLCQHLTVAPDGSVWTGRHWGLPPVSAAGYNGNRNSGPLAIALIGDFTLGYGRLEGDQRKALVRVLALLLEWFDLERSAVHLGPMIVRAAGSASRRTSDVEEAGEASACDEGEAVGPAVGFVLRELLEEVEAARQDLAGGNDEAREPLPREASVADVVREAARAMNAAAPTRDDGAEAEFPHYRLNLDDARVLGARPIAADGAAARGGAAITPEMLAGLRDHVVNLKGGLLSGEGRFHTDRADVDRIFGEAVPAWWAKNRDSVGDTLRIVLFAHGGLVNEDDGLRIADKHVGWWLSNGVYPIYFVWETGFWQTVGQLLSGANRRALDAEGVRDLWDHTTDPALEFLARRLGGVHIWGGMKHSAARAFQSGGGGEYFNQMLKTFTDAWAGGAAGNGALELHIAGHSAGSIFHSHLVPHALGLGVPPVKTAHLLAPAITIADFNGSLAGSLGNGIDDLTVFTMRKDFERSDHCAHVYRKSLLYLVHHALEPEAREPILGLEESLRRDRRTAALFGLGGQPAAAPARIVWSKTATNGGDSASMSTTHGGFDDDPPTMNSVLRRVKNLGDTDPIIEYTSGGGGRGTEPRLRGDGAPTDEAIEMDTVRGFGGPVTGRGFGGPVCGRGFGGPVVGRGFGGPVCGRGFGGPVVGRGFGGPDSRRDGSQPAEGGLRRAVCVGINDYPTAPLDGCVADAKLWTEVFKSLGFDTSTIAENQATRAGILDALEDLIGSSGPGDVIAFQFAGHGTSLPDVDGDEAGGDSPDDDEAIVPFDYEDGAYLIDDDLAEVFAKIPDGVNMTCFIDCCHSGTINRFTYGGAPVGRAAGEKRRYIRPSAEMMASHLRFRQGSGPRSGTSAVSPRAVVRQREVLFAACLSTESAYESNGQGDFTRRATQILAAGLGGLTNEGFQERVRTAFGARRRQNPELRCDPLLANAGLLQPLAAFSTAGGTQPIVSVSPTAAPTAAQQQRVDKIDPQIVAQLMRWLAGQL
jgi:hypothetical protein